MRQTIIIVLFCLFLGQVSCSRHRTSNNVDANANGSPTPSEPQGQARTYLDKGKDLYRKDEDTKAAEAFQQAIKLDPDLAEAHFRLGLAYDALGKEHEAEQAFKDAVERYKKYFAVEENARDAEAHYNLGQTYAGLRLYSEAVKEYRQATHLKDDDADVYYDLGSALTRLAQYDEAVAAFSKSLEIDPENFRAQDGLEEAKEGVDRIKAGKKHQEELLKKQKEEAEKKPQEGATPGSASTSTPVKKP